MPMKLDHDGYNSVFRDRTRRLFRNAVVDMFAGAAYSTLANIPKEKRGVVRERKRR